MTNFVRYYEKQVLFEYSMDEVENLIKDETNKKLISELIYQRYYNRFLKLFFYNSKVELSYYKKNSNAIVKNDFNTEYKNGFIIMTSCCLLIETIASYFEGINQTKKSGSEVFNFIFNKANDAIAKEKDVHGLIIHSDQGFQYTSYEYKAICESNGIQISMSRKGTPIDDSPIESWHSLLKKEPLYNNNITSLQEYIQLVEEWILFYNTTRLKSKVKKKRKNYTKREK